MITTTNQVLNVIYHPMQITKESDDYIWHLLTSSQNVANWRKNNKHIYAHLHILKSCLAHSSKKHKQSSLKTPCINFIN